VPAPVTSMTIMLRVLEQAFSEVDIRPEDWDMLRKEAEAQMQKGVSTQQVQLKVVAIFNLS